MYALYPDKARALYIWFDYNARYHHVWPPALRNLILNSLFVVLIPMTWSTTLRTCIPLRYLSTAQKSRHWTGAKARPLLHGSGPSSIEMPSPQCHHLQSLLLNVSQG